MWKKNINPLIPVAFGGGYLLFSVHTCQVNFATLR